ncbi:MAG TPA: Bcr/CflA family drug resistance efflux transporter [Actinobacteria bacterium]|nr:Bcr/CflA family drug resistance efflux transporter [Actinomycetota bacterium]
MSQQRAGRRLGLLVVLGALSGFGPLSMDLYLPSTPTIAVDLHAGQALVQLTMSGCVAGLALGQLVAGPLSDSLGRRRPLLAGLAAFVVMSLACAVAPNIGVLIVFRFLQGMAGAAGIVVSIATVRDMYDARDTARILASLTLVSGLAPVLAPVIGGQLLRVTSWRGVFCVLGGIGLALLAASWWLPETVPAARRQPPRFARMLADSATLLRDRQFAGNAVTVALSTAALFTYISTLPFIVEDAYRQSAQRFSLIFAVNALGLMAMGQLSARLVRRRSPAALLCTALVLQAAGAAALIAAASVGHPPLPWLLVPMFVIVAGFGMMRPNGTALALAGHAAIAGTASAYLGAMQFLSGAVLAPLAGVGGQGSAGPAAIIIGVLCVAALGLHLAITRGGRPPVPAPELAAEGGAD